MGSLKFDTKEFDKGLAVAGVAILDKVDKSSAKIAAEIEKDAKSNRTWKDRTGNARRSITGSSAESGGKNIIYLALGVKYGKYLELSKGGRYAIIKPTLSKWRTRFLKEYKGVIK